MIFSLLFDSPVVFVLFILVILITLSVHECAHALVAYYFGDKTAYHLGRVTLNPLSHIDSMGAITFLLLGFGWGKPVPINPLNFKNMKQGSLLTALAGPASNLIVALCTVGLYHVSTEIFHLPMNNLLVLFLQLLFFMNISLMIFNLIPVPPLDGSQILLAFIPDSRPDIRVAILTYGSQFLLVLVLINLLPGVSVFGWIGNIVIMCAQFFGMPLII
jgi:Zn-dependent protease